jgi:proteasome lid subunit RPN8/RPN11
MTVHRVTPLPVGRNRGRLIVPASVAEETRAALQRFQDPDGPHEGLVFWLGRRCGDDALILGAIVPSSNHGPQHVLIAEAEVGRMSKRARAQGLAVVAQVHSHPGADTRHSEGNDELVLMPYSGMFSLVVACYGFGAILPEEGAGLHQYQDGRWVQIAADCAGALVVIPPIVSIAP